MYVNVVLYCTYVNVVLYCMCFLGDHLVQALAFCAPFLRIKLIIIIIIITSQNANILLSLSLIKDFLSTHSIKFMITWFSLMILLIRNAIV